MGSNETHSHPTHRPIWSHHLIAFRKIHAPECFPLRSNLHHLTPITGNQKAKLNFNYDTCDGIPRCELSWRCVVRWRCVQQPTFHRLVCPRRWNLRTQNDRHDGDVNRCRVINENRSNTKNEDRISLSASLFIYLFIISQKYITSFFFFPIFRFSPVLCWFCSFRFHLSSKLARLPSNIA